MVQGMLLRFALWQAEKTFVAPGRLRGAVDAMAIQAAASDVFLGAPDAVPGPWGLVLMGLLFRAFALVPRGPVASA